jgi:glycosyltransferase involved in cell wall biosynthesis
VGIAAVLVGVPRIVLSTRNLAPHRFPYWMPYMWAAYRALLECDNVVLINNSVAGARDYARWIGVPPERVQVVLNGFSAARFKRSSPQEVAAYRRKIGIPDGMRVVGSVFRFYAEKDPMLWMRAASKIARAHPDVVFLVLGTGPMQATMLRQMRRLGLEGRLWLPGTDKNPARMLSALDVFMLTSKMEGTPNVIIEAQMLGVPVVCTDAGGSAECVEDGVTGWVVRNRNAALLARRVSEILGDDAWREHAISHAPRFAGERFALQRMLNETFELYCSPQTNARSSGWFDAVVTGG